MKHTVVFFLVAVTILTGVVLLPNEVRAATTLLRCQLQTAPNPIDPRYFNLKITKGWFDHKYAYQGYVRKKGLIKDHGDSLELLGLNFKDGRAFIEKLPKDKVRRRGRMQYYFKGQPQFTCGSFSEFIP